MASLVALPPGDGDGTDGPAQLAASGPRAEGHREDYQLLIEAIYEGYLLHYGTPRVAFTTEADLALLAGDRLYALGLAHLVALGDTEAVVELADTITLSALAQGAGAVELADAVWAAGARALGWGSSDAHRRAKALALAGAVRGDRGDAHKRHERLRVALNRASILFCTVPDKHTQHKSKYTADRMIPGAFEGETVTRRRFMTGTAHTTGAIAAASFALPALGFALGPLFKSAAALLGGHRPHRRLHR